LRWLAFWIYNLVKRACTGTAFPDQVTPGVKQRTTSPKSNPTSSKVITRKQTPTIIVTLSRANEIFLETRLDNPQSATSSQDCFEILKNQEWCNVVTNVIQLLRPEWDQLFPQTEFYLVALSAKPHLAGNASRWMT
jgi:hypothetical protein